MILGQQDNKHIDVGYNKCFIFKGQCFAELFSIMANASPNQSFSTPGKKNTKKKFKQHIMQACKYVGDVSVVNTCMCV